MVTHLHVRSAYTLLNSTLRINDIVALAKRNNCSQIALCDRNVMHGAMAFFHACKNNDIKPILGMEVECVENGKHFGFLLYAKDDIGYQQLLKLSTYLNTRKDSLSFQELARFDHHLIVTTAGDNDDLQSWMINEKKDTLVYFLQQCKEMFDCFYVAIAMNDSGLLQLKNPLLKEICLKLGIKTFALSRIYYGEKEGEEAFKTLCAIDQQKRINDPTLHYSSRRYFRNENEMKELYEDDDLQRCEEIASMCNVLMQFEKVSLPVFKNRYHVDSNTYLRNLCRKGLEKRLCGQIGDNYVKRLSYELEIIIKMGYADYFLIVYDFIRYAKTKQIYVGPGRGSAAGSLVSYCLGITQIDPIKYDLLFERFLNPERISMPDIDVDFPDDRRDEVISYVKETYGVDHVAHIVTFGTLGAKQVLRDIGRTMNIPLREIDMICKLIPSTPKITLRSAFESSGRLKQVIMASRNYQRMYELGLQLEGLPRHASTHAAGIVLSDREISDVCPLMKVEEDVYSTQFTMEYLEELGLIKMDFLGLRNLTIIDEVCHSIKEYSDPTFDIMKIPLTDQKTFQLIRDVDTMGVFQLESDGMKNLLRKMQPHDFEGIAAAIALFRPGPMENIPLYLENMKHPNNILYIHDDLKDILKNTYGVMIYQEQVMQVAQVMAGFTLGKADILRKAISKKKSNELIALRKEFIEGSISKGYDEKLSEDVYELIMKFAGYGFGRAHSIAYGLIAYQLAYLKANYPLAFFMSLLNSVIGSEYKTSQYIFEAKKRGITILHPSINYSGYKYQREEETLRYPLLNIKNVGSAAAKEILKERQQNGLYHDYFDFIARVFHRRVNRKVLESLIDAGALDEFHYSRISMKMSLDDALRYASLVSVEDDEQTRIDFELVSKPVMVLANDNAAIKSEKEKEVLGFYLSTHPITAIRQKYIKAESIIALYERKGYASLVCFVERIKEHRTKNGDLMAFLSVSDETGKMDLVCMPNWYTRYRSYLKKGCYLYVEGKIDRPQSLLIHHLELIDVTKKES